ncbi:MAG: ATP-binding protein [Elainellaceae cyanobacterium]
MRLRKHQLFAVKPKVRPAPPAAKRRLSWLPAAPLRSVLVIPFVLQVSIVVGLTGYLSIKNGEKAINELVDRLMATTGQMVRQHLDDYLSMPDEISRINVNLVEQGIVDARDFEALGKHFWQQAQIYPPGSYFGFALETGEYIGAGDWLDGEGVVIDRTLESGESVSYKTDVKGDLGEVIHQYEYFPKEEGWYSKTVAAQRPIWSTAIEAVEPPYVAAGITQPVYAPDGTLLGVMTTDLVLSYISDFLQRLNPSENGRLFIIERDGRLVGSSHTANLFTEVDGELEIITVSMSDDALSRAVAQQLQSTFGEFDAIHQDAITKVEYGGDRYLVRVIPWHDDSGLDWLVVMVIPESEFMEQIQANTRLTIYLCLVALAAAIGLGLVTSRWIAAPVLRLNRASRAIAQAADTSEANYYLNQRVVAQGIREIETLADSFNQMAAKLQASFRALETSNLELEQRVTDRTAELTEALTNLRQAQARLIHAEKMSGLGQLVAGVAHEINNPVTFIYSNLEYARRYVEDLLRLVEFCQNRADLASSEFDAIASEVDLEFLRQDLPKLLDSMQSGSDRIHHIVKSLRTFAQLEGSPLKVVDIHAGIDSTLMMLHSQLKTQRAASEIHVLKDYGPLPRVECYAGQLNQVFMHLLNNAIQAFGDCSHCQCPCNDHPDGRQIHIRTQLSEDDQAIISIADNGPGISEEARSHLFNPFFTTRPVGQGQGLGLSISYQIITELHGGSISCISQLGQGSEFILKIPLTQTFDPPSSHAPSPTGEVT